ncbi:MAG: BamA/TamA family outer membrane protein [Myxococcales bacterium]
MTLEMTVRGPALLALLLAWAALGCATTPRPSPDAPEVRHLTVEGESAVTAKEIQARIVTEGRSWVPFAPKRYYDEAVLETDLKRVLRLYQAEGFYEASIAERTVTPAGKGKVDVTIRIDEGPATRVRSLSFLGLPETQRSELLLACPLREGETFREADYEACKAKLGETLAEAGYAEAAVGGRAIVDLPTHRADVTLEVQAGQPFRFGNIFVAGAESVPHGRIEVTARDALPYGAPWRASALAEAQRRVFDLGVFSTVRLVRGAPDREAGLMPVVVSVREAPFRTLRIGAGLGLDPRFTELPRVSIEWTHRNFLGGLRRLTLTGAASLVYLPSLWVLLSSRGQNSGVDVAFTVGSLLEQPEIIGHNTSLTLNLGVERNVDTAFRSVSASAGVGLVYRRWQHFELAPSFQFQLFKLSGAAASAVTASSQEAVLDACAAAGQLCRLAYLEQRVAYDLRDNPVETTRGAYFSLSLQEGSRYLGGAYDYVRVLPAVRAYLPLGPVVVAARVQAGVLGTFGGTSSSVLTRFFLGGNTTQRGFGNRQLAPSLVACRYRDPDTQACQTAEQAGKDPGTDITEVLPIGGNAMIGANLEVRIPLPASFGLVTFVDVGEVTPEPGDLSFDKLNVALGLGVRYRTLFGPIRFDVAWRMNTPPIALTFASDLPPGAVPAPLSRIGLQFSIGEAY